MKYTHLLLLGFLSLSLVGVTSCAGPGPIRRADYREDRRDHIENRIDESYNRGPLDRMEDRRDRREDRRDRLGF